jgi:predicted exporter
MTSLLSFGLLAVSSIPVVNAFGVTLLIGNLSNLIGAFIYSEQLSHYEQ